MLQGLRSELYRLSLKGGKINGLMAAYRPPEVEVIIDPVRVAKLAMIAKAYTACQITAQQAKELVSKV